ncbi:MULTISPECIES: DUF6158 family protein [Parafrankia]|uniref:Uncharacterized protein n=1 Tax=Parafrankia soli TaxID=2599596 RepID=A0A1S1PMC5_9ACTN|nr:MULTISPECIES: DUF6158 family protein [Parafrankia]OHV22840.1 hypothetical protein BBK14_24925 [Parafrankia soli]TCJ38545.1 hypothetical protein E0504_13755 [Parafrankia sp. BMG5.11]CAI7978978.1 conserved hypothetical protein [Frankia sp. Hr75.2]SQD95247.1 conserved hypothetical protein [Parafrankia sp. Ea1.12]
MTHRPEGIPAPELSDSDLVREVRHLHLTRHDTFLAGSEDAFETHTQRMLELEREYLRRFPDAGSPDPRRTRAGRRRAAGVAG